MTTWTRKPGTAQDPKTCRSCARSIVRCNPGSAWVHTDGGEGCRDAWRHTLTGDIAAPVPPQVAAVKTVPRRRGSRNLRWWKA